MRTQEIKRFQKKQIGKSHKIEVSQVQLLCRQRRNTPISKHGIGKSNGQVDHSSNYFGDLVTAQLHVINYSNLVVVHPVYRQDPGYIQKADSEIISTSKFDQPMLTDMIKMPNSKWGSSLNRRAS